MHDDAHDSEYEGTACVHGATDGEVVASDVELSFWGGVNPATGEVVDRHHPLSGQIIAGKILAIPGGRGSCSGSGVMLELLLNGKGPKAMIFSRQEDILTLGVVVAEEIFGRSLPVVRLAPDDFRRAVKCDRLTIDGRWVSGHAFSAPPPTRDPPVDDIALSAGDRALLDGAHGEAAQVAMRILVRMSRLQGAKNLIDISQVHVDGCIYTGPGSLAFARRLRDLGGKVVVPTTLNSISVDERGWRAQKVDPAFGEPASALGRAYLDMGAQPTFTCAPYLLDTAPGFGEQIAWAESNAVVFANSVLGARTMKYPDFLDICIALTGRAPGAGAHLDINRKATLRVDLSDFQDFDDEFYPLLGYAVGRLSGDRIPVVVGLEGAAPSMDDLKAFGAAFATVSSAPMFHILGVTPEAVSLEDIVAENRESIVVSAGDVGAAWGELNGAFGERVDLVSFGSPHFSFSEIERLASLCRGRSKHPDVAVVVTTGRSTYGRANAADLIDELRRFGVEFIQDTCWCMIADPIVPPGARTIMTNSAKYAHYGPGLTGRAFCLGGMKDCVDAACSTRRTEGPPAWLRDKSLRARLNSRS